MPEKQEVQEWYGRNARVMHSDSDCLINGTNARERV